MVCLVMRLYEDMQFPHAWEIDRNGRRLRPTAALATVFALIFVNIHRHITDDFHTVG